MRTIALISFTRTDYPLLIGLLGVGYDIRISTPHGILSDGADVADLINCTKIGIRNQTDYKMAIDGSDAIIDLSTEDSPRALKEFSKSAEAYARSLNKPVAGQKVAERTGLRSSFDYTAPPHTEDCCREPLYTRWFNDVI